MKTLYFRNSAISAALVALGTCVALPARGMTKVKLDSIPPEYRPTAGSEMPEAVSMQDFYFEVNKETRRARVVVEYTYPDQAAFGADGGLGPQSTVKQLPGLKYDDESKSVIYDADGKRTVCATVNERKVLFWRTSEVKPTGSCTVTSGVAEHAEDNGWSIDHNSTVDTYLEVR